MENEGESLEQGYTGSVYDSSLEAQPAAVMEPVGDGFGRRRLSPFRYNRLAFVVTGISIILIILVAVASLFFGNHGSKNNQTGSKAASYAVGSLSTDKVKANAQLKVGNVDHLAVNGQLQVSNTLVLAPTSTPSAPVSGQIYYDKTTHTPFYYNGTTFVSLSPDSVKSLGGLSGTVVVGDGLSVNNNQLSVSSKLLQAVASSGLSAPRVSSFQGLNGDINLTAGPGIAIAGTNISNQGVLSLTGTINQINVSTASGNISISLPQDIAPGSTPTFAGQRLTGSLVFADGSGHFTTLQGATLAQDQIITIPDSGGASDTVCLQTLANCGSSGGGVNSVGASQNFLPKFTNALGTQIGNSLLYDNGVSIGVGTNTPGASFKLDVNGNANISGSTTVGGNLNVTGNARIAGLTAGIVHSDGSGNLSSGSVALGTDTSGSYVASLGTLTGLATTGNSGAGSTPTLSVSYGNTANTAVQGNTQITCPSGIGNLSGGGTVITLGTGGTCGNLSITNSPTFSGTLSVQAAGGITVGNTGVNGLLNFTNASNSFIGSLRTAAIGQATTYTLPDPGGGSATICLNTGNCAGTGGGVTTTGGTTNKLAVFTGTNTIGNSSITDNGSLVTIAGDLSVNAITAASLQSAGILNITSASDLNIGTNNQVLALQGNASSTFKASASGFTTTVGFVAPTANRSITFPNEGGVVCLQGSSNCGFSAGGSGVTSIIGALVGSTAVTGALTLNNATSTGTTITIADASGTAKGIAQFGTRDFSVSAGVVAAIQDISTTAAAQFGSLTLGTGDLTLGAGKIVHTDKVNSTGSGLTLSGGTGNVTFTNQNGANSFMFPTSGGLGQVICTSGITCASGGGQAVILEPSGVQTANGNTNSVFINKASGTGNLLQLQAGGLDALVINALGEATLSNATTAAALTVTGTLTTNTITPTAALTIGSTTQAYTLQGSVSSAITALDGGFTTTVGFGRDIVGGAGAPTGSVSYKFENDSLVTPGSYFVCTTAGNCTGVGGSVTASGGVAGQIAKFTAAGNISSSIIAESSNTITVAGNLAVGTSGASQVSIGVGSTVNGSLVFNNATNNNTLTIQQAAAPAGNITLSLPTHGGTFVASVAAGGALQLDATTGEISCPSCLVSGGGAGGGVSTITGSAGGSSAINGALTLNDAFTSGTTITLNNAFANGTNKGIATFNSTNFSDNGSGVINTTQDIAVASSPSFSNLTLQGATGLTLGTTSNIGQIVFKDGTNDGFTNSFRQATLTQNQVLTIPNASGTLAVAVSGSNLSLSATGTLSFSNSPTFSTSVTTPLLQSTGALSITPGGTLTAGALTQQFALQGNTSSTIGIKSSVSGKTTTVSFNAPATVDQAIVFPDASGEVCLKAPANNCGFAAGGSGVTSITGSAGGSVAAGGAITFNDALTTGSAITLNNAKADGTTKGIAAFNGTNFSDNGSGVINTTQNINTGASPSFAGLTLSGLADGLVRVATGVLSGGAVDRNSSTYFNTALTVANGGTGAGSFTSKGIIFGNGAATLQVTNSAANSVLVTDGSSNPSLSQTLPTQVQDNITRTGALVSGSIASGFGTISTGSTITTTTTLQGGSLNVGSSNQFQVDASGNVNTSGTATFTNSAGVTIGAAGTVAGKLVLATTGVGSVTLSSAAQANAVALSIPADTNATDEVCLKTVANCTSSGGVGNYINNATAQQTNGNFNIQARSATVAAVIQGASSQDIFHLDASGGGTVFKVDSAGAITAPTSTNTINGLVINGGALTGVTGITTNGAYTQSGSGANTLTGATTLSAAGTALSVTNNAEVRGILSVGSTGQLQIGATGNLTTSGTLRSGVSNSVAGSLILYNAANTHITTLQGLASASQDQVITVPASTATTDTVCLVTLANCTGANGGSGNTNYIYNQTSQQTTANFNIQARPATVAAVIQGASSQDIFHLDASGGGTVFKVDSAGAITAPTTTNTINGLIINSGALTGVTGITTNGAYIQSGSTANTLTGATTLSAAGTALSVTNNAEVKGIFKGGSTGQFQVDASGNISTSGTITGATTVNTINGLVINGGALTAVTGITTNGAYVQSGSGANTLTGATTLSAAGTALSVTNNAEIKGILSAGSTGQLQVDASGNLTTSGTLRAGVSNSVAGSLILYNASNTHTTTIRGLASGSQDQVITVPASTATTDTVCLVTLGNCTGVNGGSGNTNYIFNQTAQQTTANFNIQARSATVAAVIQGASSQDIFHLDASGGGTVFKVDSAGAITAPTSTNTINGLIINSGALTGVTGITTNGAYTQSGAGANTLTGATTLSAAGTALSVTNNAEIKGILSVGSTGQLQVDASGNLATSGTLKAGVSNSLAGSLIMYNASNTHTTTLQGLALSSQDQVITIPASTATTDTVCLVTLANCTNANGGTGNTNYIFNQTSQQTNGNINIQARSATVAAVIQGASGQDIVDFVANGGSTVAKIDVTGALTAVGATLNGNTSVTGASTFAVGTGATTLGGTLVTTGTATFNGSGNGSTTYGALFKNTTNSTTAFSIQNALANTTLFNADTTNNALQVTGQTTLTGGLSVSGLSVPAAPTVTPTGTTGATNYSYVITARTAGGYETTASTAGSTATGNATLTGVNYNAISWTAVPGASSYRIYRTVGGATQGLIGTTATLGLNDTGLAASGSAPTINTTDTLAAGNATFRNAADSSNTFQVQNAAGTTVLNVDTSAKRVTIGVTRGTPTGQLYVGGQVPTAANGQVNGQAASYGIAVQGRYAYLTPTGSTNGLQIFDVSNPASPALIKSVNTTSTSAKKVKVQGKYAYVAGGGTLQVFDISNPFNPTSVGSQTYTASTGTQALYVQGRYAYVGESGTATFYVFDISNPTVIPAATTLAIGTASNGASDIYIQGRYAYVLNQNSSNTFQIIDISTPTSPSIVSTVASTSLPGGSYMSLAVQGRYVFVGQASGSIYPIDVSNPAIPVVGSAVSMGGGTAQALYSQGRYLYAADGTNSVIRTFDISTPSTPALLSGTISGQSPLGLTVAGRYMYTSNNSATNTLQVFDLGGMYSQQLEAGGIETDTLNVRGNGNFASDLAIQGALGIGGGLQVAGNSGFSGAVSIQATSTNAFQVKNAAGTSLFNLDTTNSGVTLGNAGATGTIQIGNTTGAVAQTINIGNNATATSNTTVVVGSAIDGSTTTIQSGTGNLNLSPSGASNTGVVVKPGTESTSAFQIQSASSKVLFNVDSTNSKLTVVSGLAGEIAPVNNAAGSTLPVARDAYGSATANGYVYIVGGHNSVDSGTSGGRKSTLYYAKVNADGSLGSWKCQGQNSSSGAIDYCGVAATNTNTLTGAISDASATVYNGYIYLTGGYSGGSSLTTVQYAKLNADGSTGAWTNINSLAFGRDDHGTIAMNGYIYTISGERNATVSGTNSNAQYAKINTDGTLGTWTQLTDGAGLNGSNGARNAGVTAANGYIYVVGGDIGGSQTTVYANHVNSDGTLSSWVSLNALQTATTAGSAHVSNGYLYLIGGNGSTAIQYAKLNGDGSVGTWATSTRTLPLARAYAGFTGDTVNGYMYILGGTTTGGGTSANTTYSISSPRLSVGGILDLVGINGIATGDAVSGGYGGVGGELIAGNTSIVGSLQVQGAATFNQNMQVNASLNVRPTTDSTTAFQVQNAAGNTLLNVDSSTASISIGSAGLAGTLQIGNITGAVAQTINIGTNATASSSTALTIGSTIGASATTIRSGTGNVNISPSGTSDTGVIVKPGTDSANAFNVQNAGGTNVLNIDTSGLALNVNAAFNVTGISTIGSPTLTSSGTGGTLAANTYYYRVSARNVNGSSGAVNTTPGSVTTTGSTSRNTITWSAVTGATNYYLYRSTDNITFQRVSTGNVTSAIDNGSNFTWSGPDRSTDASFNQTSYFQMAKGGQIALDPAGNAVLYEDITNDAIVLAGYGGAQSIIMQGNAFYFEDTTGYADNLAITNTGATTLKNRVDSTAALRVLNTSNKSVAAFDTSNGKLILGDQSASGVTGTLVLNTANNANAITLQAGATSSSYTLTLPTAIGSTSRCLTTGSVTASQLQFSGCFSNGGNSFGALGQIGTNDANNLNFRTNNVDRLALDQSGNLQFLQASTLNAASSATGNQLTIAAGAATTGTNVGANLLLQGGAGASTGASGSVIVKSNVNNSTTAFQVQDASSNPVLSVNTTNGRVGVGIANGSAALTVAGSLDVFTGSGSALVVHDSQFSTVYGLAVDTIGSSLITNYATTIRTNTNSTTALLIQNTNSKAVGTFDTTNGKFILGDQSAVSGITGSLVFNTANNANAVTLQSGATSSAYSLTLPTAIGTTSQCLTAGSVTASQLQFSNCLSNGGNSFGALGQIGTNDAFNLNFRTNNADRLALDQSGNLQFLQVSTLNVASATTGSQLSIAAGAATSGTNVGGNLLLQGGAGASTGASGSVIVRSNTNNSTTALQIQNSSSKAVATFDTSTGKVILGDQSVSGGITGALVFNTANNVNAVTLQSGATSSAYALTLPTAIGTTSQCLTTGSVTASQLQFSNCFSNGGNSFGALGQIGTNDAFNLNFRTNNADRLALDQSGNLQFQQASTLNIASAATGTQLTIAAGSATSGTNTGGNLLLQAGAGASTGASGSVIVKSNTNNSTNAFNVQNASGTSLVSVDTANNILNLNVQNGGALTTWATGNSSGMAARGSHASVVANGYVYVIGGHTMSTGTETGAFGTVQFAKLNADGTVGNWTTTTALGVNRVAPSAVFVNGYIYVIGGSTTQSSSNIVTSVYYGKVNADGTVSSWNTTSTLNAAVFYSAATYSNGYIYNVAGSAAGSVGNVQYARVNADGSLGTWNNTTSTTVGPTNGERDSHSTFISGRTIYVVGGERSGVAKTNVMYNTINSNGTLGGSWTDQGATNAIPYANESFAMAVTDGYVYAMGGWLNASAQTNKFYYAPIPAAGGQLGAWTDASSTNPIPANRGDSTAVAANGYLYVMNGTDAVNTSQANVYVASTGRIRVGGSLDLVGLTGQNLADGTSNGGTLTAGNTNIVGTLQVQGASNFAQDVGIGANLNVGGNDNISGTLTVAGAVTFSSTLTVTSMATFNGGITVGGHIITTGTAPTFAVGATATTTGGTGSSCSVSGTDTTGTITFVAGTGTAISTTGTLCTITFNSGYASAPRVVLGAADANGGRADPYVGSIATGSFVVGNTVNVTASQTYTFTYITAQ